MNTFQPPPAGPINELLERRLEQRLAHTKATALRDAARTIPKTIDPEGHCADWLNSVASIMDPGGDE